MKNYYWLLIAASVSGLASCSNDGTKTANVEQAHPATEPPAAASHRVPADSTIRVNLNTVAAVRAQPTVSGHSTLTRAKLKAASGFSAPPRPTTYADAPADEEVESDSSRAANAFELEQFLASGLPVPQRFIIRPGRDTLLTGAQGTQLLLAAGAWEVPTDSGPVEVEMQEFYSTPDIVLAGLTTTAGPDLLETGGMIHLKATANGQPIRLRPGNAVHLRMPTTQQQRAGMQLFESPGLGARPSAVPVNWQLPPAPGLAMATPPQPQPTARPATWRAKRGGRSSRRWRGRRQRTIHSQYTARYIEVPEYPGGEARALKSLPRLIGYSPATLARLRKALRKGRRMGKTELVELRQASTRYGEHMLRLVHVSFRVDSLGKTNHLVAVPNTDAALSQAVLEAVGKLRIWEPALMPQLPALNFLTEVPAFGKITAYFSASGKVVVDDSVSWDRPASWAFRDSVTKAQTRLANERQRAYYASLTPQQRRVLDSTAQVRLYKERDRLYQQLGNRESAAINQDILYNELSAQSLGWINCDRFLNPGPRIQYVVNAALRNTIVTLVFRDIRAAMGSSTIGGRTIFDNVPAGQAATVVALRREKGTTYLAKRDVLIDRQGLGSLEFRPVTIAELRTELSQ